MKKIMFNDTYGGLTEAVINRVKTQTRRLINVKEESLKDFITSNTEYIINKYSKYKIGEEVAIAQKYEVVQSYVESSIIMSLIGSAGWLNKMFVDAKLMPHRIKITNIRVERLKDISDEDCLKEGIIKLRGDILYAIYQENVGDRFYRTTFTQPKMAYKHLIRKITGRGTWDSNPYVFVYDFELIK